MDMARAQFHSPARTERGFPGAGAGLRRHLGPVQQHNDRAQYPRRAAAGYHRRGGR